MTKTYTFLMASLVATTALISPAFAGGKGLTYGAHKFGGEIKLQSEHHSNVGAAPGSSGVSFNDLDDSDDDDSFGDDMIDDVLDDVDLDEDELAEANTDGDLDNDGLDDALDANLPVSRTDAAWRSTLSGQLKHAYEFSKDVTLKSAFKMAGSKVTDRDDLDKVNWAVSTGPVFKLIHNIELQPSVTFMSVDKDITGRATDTWVGSLGAEWKASKQWAFGARYNYQDRDIVAENGTDANVDSLKFEAKYKPTKVDQFKVGFSPAIEDATRANKNKDKYSFSAGYQHDFANNIKLATGVKYSYTDNVNLTRQDNDTTYDVGVQKAFDSGVYVGTGLAYKARGSNVAVKSNHDAAWILNTGWKF